MKRVLFDTNVVLDVVLDRAPHKAASASALDLVARGELEGYVAGHAVTTIAYLVEREQGAAQARRALVHLLSKVRVAPVTDAVIRTALALDLTDFEDAVCIASAQEAGCTTIVTRNVRHFRKSVVPAVAPDAFLASRRKA